MLCRSCFRFVNSIRKIEEASVKTDPRPPNVLRLKKELVLELICESGYELPGRLDVVVR